MKFDMDETDLTSAERKVNYEEIMDYVLTHSGLKVTNLYIAQIKQKYDIIERENYNISKLENEKWSQRPLEKVIVKVLKQFKIFS